ncbi:sec24-related protein [Anaeramoeba ignava]|uniref:Sec24-related protein n=1 Tax=Anaeramoeba ignava TaxID=1746090 RepID=A0A9Q0LHS5_ANAIG|nr:sec24-related protein [Anaeramoeba ignava]
MDIQNRPELTRGSVEFMATKDYLFEGEALSPPSFVFLIQMNHYSIHSGIHQNILCGIEKSVQNLPQNSRIGIILYDQYIKFFGFHLNTEPEMILINDSQDVFLPIPQEYLLTNNIGQFLRVLKMIQNLNMEENTGNSINFKSAIKAASLILEKIGGEIILFYNSLSLADLESFGDTINEKEKEKEDERKFYTPRNDYYTKLAHFYNEKRICMNIFAFQYTNLELATISELAKSTGGLLNYYENYYNDRDGEYLQKEIMNLFSKTMGFGVQMKLRTSIGVSVQEIYGHFEKNEFFIYCSSMREGQSVAFNLGIENNLQENSKIFIQFAMLYTTTEAQKRIRVFNLAFETSNIINHIIKSADQEIITNIIAKKSINHLSSLSILKIREEITQKCIDIFLAYKKNGDNKNPRILVFPERLRYLILYCLGLIKNTLFNPRKSQRINLDYKYSMKFYIETLNAPLTSILFYPKLIYLNDIIEEENLEQNYFENTKLSFSNINQNGIYFIDNGIEMFIWLSSEISTELLEKLFGISTFSSIKIDQLKLVLFNQYQLKLDQLIKECQNLRTKVSCLKIIDNSKSDLFEKFLVEDATQNFYSYREFLSIIHQQIELKLKD